jgi:hypothetical protein
VSTVKKPITVPRRQRASIAFTDRRSSVVAWTYSLIWESNRGASPISPPTCRFLGDSFSLLRLLAFVTLELQNAAADST